MKNGHNPTCLFEYVTSKDVIVSLEHDADVIRSITELARSRGVEAGSFTAIGALKCARLGYFDQKRREYREMEVDMPHEMASCVGNISLRDGEPFVHAHAVLAEAFDPNDFIAASFDPRNWLAVVFSAENVTVTSEPGIQEVFGNFIGRVQGLVPKAGETAAETAARRELVVDFVEGSYHVDLSQMDSAVKERMVDRVVLTTA